MLLPYIFPGDFQQKRRIAFYQTLDQRIARQGSATFYENKANVRLIVQAINFEYEGGVLNPPAYNFCRCSMVYFGVTPAMLRKCTEDGLPGS